MATTWTAYDSRPILLDVTVPLLAAGATVQSQVTGTRNYGAGPSSTIQVTTNSILSTALAQGYVADALDVEIIPPQMATGTQPDCIVWFTNGSTALDGYQYIDASLQGCMMPRAKLTRGLRRMSLGLSARDLILAGADNLPLSITGIKITSQLTLNVYSAAGWTSPEVPLRVVVRGDLLSDTDLAQVMQAGYNGQFEMSALGVPSYRNVHTPAFGGSPAAWWASLPGGVGQKGVKINRRINFATNGAATTASGQYVFSENNSVLGVPGNVAQADNDLGDNFKNSNNALLYTDIGLNLYVTGRQALFAVKVDGTVVPQDTPNGTYVTSGNNDFQFGSTGAGDGQFFGLVPASTLSSILVAGNAVVPIVTSADGSTFAAGTVEVARAGVLVEAA